MNIFKFEVWPEGSTAVNVEKILAIENYPYERRHTGPNVGKIQGIKSRIIMEKVAGCTVLDYDSPEETDILISRLGRIVEPGRRI